VTPQTPPTKLTAQTNIVFSFHKVPPSNPGDPGRSERSQHVRTWMNTSTICKTSGGRATNRTTQTVATSCKYSNVKCASNNQLYLVGTRGLIVMRLDVDLTIFKSPHARVLVSMTLLHQWSNPLLAPYQVDAVRISMISPQTSWHKLRRLISVMPL
jgi:hypothetical protein